MFCSKCGAELQAGARFCSKCGYEITDESIVDAASTPNIYDSGEGIYNNDLSAVVSNDSVSGNRKRKMQIVGIVTAVAVLLIAVIVFINSNTFKRMFYSPAEYYRYVEKKNAEEKIGHIIDYYGSLILDSVGGENGGSEQTVSLKISEEILGEIEGVVGGDYGFLSDVNIVTRSSLEKGLSQTSVDLSMGNTNIITLDAISDAEKKSTYLNIPQINSTYMEIASESIGRYSQEAEEVARSVNNSASIMDVVEALPKAAQAQQLLNKYSDIVLNNITDVELVKEDFKVKEVQATSYVLSINLDKDTLKGISRELRKTALEDEELENIIKSSAKLQGADEEKVYKSFCDVLYSLEEEIVYLDGSSMNVYVDSKGSVIGREIELNYGGAPTIVMWGTVTKGRKFGTTVKVKINGTEYVDITGTGKKAGEKYSGDFKTEILGMKNKFTVDFFDMKALREMRPNCQITVPIDQFSDSIMAYLPQLQFLGSYDLVLMADYSSARNGECSISLSDGSEAALTIGTSIKEIKTSEIKIPNNVRHVEDATSLKQYLMDSNLDVINTNLRTAGVPESMVAQLEEIERYIEYLDMVDLMY